MKGFLKINDDTLGEVDFKVVDEGMGVIGGDLTVYPAYGKYKEQIQILTDRNGSVQSQVSTSLIWVQQRFSSPVSDIFNPAGA